ncbi:hypothetical protein, partial [Romboutsia sp.]|uniref:hypothetical protein n=1 Tax=Romboutsia sp. TaxID=1965302 RepID=UPI003F3684F3
APIVTIAIPYKFMKDKDENKVKENRKVLNNLFIFNIITFAGVTLLANKTSYNVSEIIVNLMMTFVYFKILCSMEKKKESVFDNPEKEYEKMNQRIEALEMIYEKVQQDVESAQNEKAKSSKQVKVDTLKIKIEQAKKQLEFLEKQIELKKSNSQ